MKWSLIGLLVFCLMGTGYAAYSNILVHQFSLGTGTMGFEFDDCENGRAVTVEFQKSDQNPVELKAEATYDGKKLTISELGPLNLQDLSDGDTAIFLCYRIKAEDEDHGLKQTAMMEGDDGNGLYLGEIDLQRNNQTPVWSLQNVDQFWGTAEGSMKASPIAVYDFLPDRLCRFKAYQVMEPAEEEGVMNGTIVLKQSSLPDVPDSVPLSSFALPESILKEMKKGPAEMTLVVNASYKFSIPIRLEQFNFE